MWLLWKKRFYFVYVLIFYANFIATKKTFSKQNIFVIVDNKNKIFFFVNCNIIRKKTILSQISCQDQKTKIFCLKIAWLYISRTGSSKLKYLLRQKCLKKCGIFTEREEEGGREREGESFFCPISISFDVVIYFCLKITPFHSGLWNTGGPHYFWWIMSEKNVPV